MKHAAWTLWLMPLGILISWLVSLIPDAYMKWGKIETKRGLK